ncbi:T9SS type A sorting domain-containing protein [Algibacter sp. 2305UL17-15]|uniref:T9SS type A sorting domain-containing protein n=1 Tax=Algibacter sp. 2305UL17-15 TaxID=3231268 RepID=UPI003457D4A9
MKRIYILTSILFLLSMTVTAQTFPDTFEFRGIHQNSGAVMAPLTAPGPNPAGLDTAVLPTATGRLSAPVLVDLDGDSDLDMVSGAQDAAGKLYYYENIGTPTAPNWVQTALPTLDAVAIAPGGNNETKPAFVDIDNDNDFDLFLMTKNDENSNNFNDIHFYENTGTVTVPNFVASTLPGILNQNISNFPSITFVDLDDDDDYDIVGMGSDSLSYMRNIGTKALASFERKYHLENPWDMNTGTGILDRNWPHGDNLVTIPNFQDVDNDGDFDLIMGTDTGVVHWVENIGTAAAPDYGSYTYQNLGGDLATFDFGQFANISFGDVNSDGILDAILGSFNPGHFAWFEGVSTTPARDILALIGIDEEDVAATSTNATATELNDLATVSGAIEANEGAYQAYIDGNNGNFSSPATEAEVQTMVTAVNASQMVLLEIGQDADNGSSDVTSIELEAIIPAITGIVMEDESLYQDYIANNPNAFSAPATAAEVQAMVNAVNNTLGVNKHTLAADVKLYPNPTSTIVTISHNIKHVSVFDVTGKKVFETAKNSFNVSKLKTGIYLIEITLDSGNKVVKRLIRD